MRRRAWCITWFSEDPDAAFGTFRDTLERRGRVGGLTGTKNDVRRACAQLEPCPSSGRVHVQGYIQFANAVRESTLHKLFPGSWLKEAKGNPQSNLRYCTDATKRVEGGDAFVLGDFPAVTQGRRTDLERFTQELQADGLDAAIQSDPTIIVRYPRGVLAYHQHLLKQRWNSLPSYRHQTVWLHVGEAGRGKTRAVFHRAHEQFQQLPYVLFSTSPEWWDGYDGQQVILLDDFYGQLPLNRLLRILDGYPLLLPVKGGHTYNLFSEIHITTNQNWENWYQIIRERDQSEVDTGRRLYEALKRRITRVIQYNSL